MRLAIDGIMMAPEETNLLMYAALLVGVAGVQGIFRFYMRKLLVGISRKVEYLVRTDFFSHLQRIHSSFFTNTRTGSIMALATNDLEAVRNFLGPGILNLFNTIFVFVSTLTVMFLINVRLSLYSLIAIPILPVLVSKLSAMLHTRFRASQEQYASLSARTQESIAGIKVIKSFTREEHEKEVFKGLNREYINRNLSLARIRAAFWPAMVFIGGIGILVVLWIGGNQVVAQTLTLGQFVQFSAYIGAITWPLISLGWVINLVQRGSVSMKRINKVLDIKPRIRTPKHPIRPKEVKGDIEFRHVYFKYENEELYDDYVQKNIMDRNLLAASPKNGNWILKDINIDIEAGTQTGIVGFTGSAKSSLLNLTVRLYDPQRGKILLDGFDLRTLDLDILRASVGYVTQEPFLFSKTIKENILFGCKDIDRLGKHEITERIEHAAKVSQLHEEIIEFPQDYDTVIGERGITLSGGQKQRLAIARALAKQPSVLILDDSFSNVDTHTEERIVSNLRKETRDITTIMVSHRISTVKDSDLILVMDGGEIVEKGTHEQLLKTCGIYLKLHQRQKLSEELEEEL